MPPCAFDQHVEIGRHIGKLPLSVALNDGKGFAGGGQTRKNRINFGHAFAAISFAQR